MAKRVHFRYAGYVLCKAHGYLERWQSQDITSTGSYSKVTCKRCQQIAVREKFTCAQKGGR